MDWVRFTWMPPNLMLWVPSLKDSLVFSHSDSSQIFLELSYGPYICLQIHLHNSCCLPGHYNPDAHLQAGLHIWSLLCWFWEGNLLLLVLSWFSVFASSVPFKVREWAHLLSVLWSARGVHRAPKCYWPSVSCKHCQNDWGQDELQYLESSMFHDA